MCMYVCVCTYIYYIYIPATTTPTTIYITVPDIIQLNILYHTFYIIANPQKNKKKFRRDSLHASEKRENIVEHHPPMHGPCSLPCVYYTLMHIPHQHRIYLLSIWGLARKHKQIKRTRLLHIVSEKENKKRSRTGVFFFLLLHSRHAFVCKCITIFFVIWVHE